MVPEGRGDPGGSSCSSPGAGGKGELQLAETEIDSGLVSELGSVRSQVVARSSSSDNKDVFPKGN